MSADLVLVTGASGFIGSHVVKQLLEQGFRVRGTVRSKSNEKKVKPLMDICPSAEHPLELAEADLTKPEGWLEAVQGCSYVMHVASPFPSEEPRDEQELIKPAVDGTLHVLRACKEAGGVKRVVLTSSVAAIQGEPTAKSTRFTEEDWTDVESCKMAYLKSKTLAEKAAWDFVKELSDDEKFELAVINPTLVMGPVLCGTVGTSMEIMLRFLNREMPMLPKLNFCVTDVRDVAAAHIAAMKIPEANGNRHICVTQTTWMSDLGKILDTEFKPQGYNIPTMTAPYPFLWVYGRFDKTVKMILPSIGKVVEFDGTRMRDVLGIQPYSLKDTLVDMAYSMIENGQAKKTDKYKGPTKKDVEEAKEAMG